MGKYSDQVFQHFPKRREGKPELNEVYEKFYDLAHWISENLPEGPEKTVSMRSLLNSKDAAVRARLEETGGVYNPRP